MVGGHSGFLLGQVMAAADASIDWLIESGSLALREIKLLNSRPLKIHWGATRLSDAQQNLLIEQIHFRQRAAGRFPDPDEWLWTDRSLQQASDWHSAQAKAALFPEASPVVDLCCGAGADLVALAPGREVLAMDRDSVMLKLARYNLRAHGLDGHFVQAELPGPLSPGPDICIHADPDRRRGAERNTRTIQGESFSPALSDLVQLGERARACLIKLAPATEIEAALEHTWHRLWLGVGRECPQQVLAYGDVGQSVQAGMRTAMLVDRQQQTYTGSAAIVCDTADEPEHYVIEPHAALYASGLTPAWAVDHGLYALPFSGSYLTGNSAIRSPWAQTFEVLDHMSWHERRVRKWLAAHQAGPVEVKTRNAPVDANALQRQLSKPDGQPITCLLYRLGKSIRVVMARRMVT